ncbi:hypothetical protein D3C78_1595690 [compost metagenome]
MAPGVVDLLEVVDVQHYQHVGLAAALGASAFLAQALHQQAAVGDAGQRIAGRGVLQRDVEVAQHDLVAVGDPRDLFQLAQLLVIALGEGVGLLAGHRLIAVGNTRDTLKTRELLHGLLVLEVQRLA